MTAIVGRSVRAVTKGGKTKLVRKRSYASKNQHFKASRLENAWRKKDKTAR